MKQSLNGLFLTLVLRSRIMAKSLVQCVQYVYMMQVEKLHFGAL